MPREEQASADPRRLPPCRDILSDFSERTRTFAPRLGGFGAKIRTPIRFYVARAASVSSGQFRRYVPLASFELGRDDVVRLATPRAPRSRCVRPMSASQHSTYEYPYSPALGSIVSRLLQRLRVRNELRPLRPRNRTFHDVRDASGDRLNCARCYRPCESTFGRLTCLCGDLPSDTPVASLTRLERALSYAGVRCGDGRQIVSTSVP